MIPEATIDSVLDHVSVKKPDNQREFKETLTDEEIRAFIEAATKASDDAEVPAEVPTINFADEFDRAVNEALDQ